MQTLNAEIQKMEETLQEERMEKVKLEVEIGREKDCNRVREFSGLVCWIYYIHTCKHNIAQFYSPNYSLYSI